MVLFNNFTFVSTVIAKLPQQKIAQVISVCLLVYITSVAAKITWLIVPNTTPINSHNGMANVKRTDSQSADKNIDLSRLDALNLFGAYNESIVEATQVVVKNAPETRLKLTLSGLVASDQVDTAAAIIEYQKKQETYGIGDLITGTRASLEQVLIDRVIIKQSGRLETLMLDGADYNQPGQSVANKNPNNHRSDNAPQQGKAKKLSKKPKQNVVDQRSNKKLSQNAQRLRADLKSDPGKITDYLRISPARKGGKIIGYRLSAGKKPEFFKLSGLKSGDIAVQMNGYDLLAPLEALQAMSALKTERDISLLVERKNDLIEILFTID